MTDPKAAPINPTTTALVPYGESAEVKSMARRIMRMHPSARQIGEKGALLLAQLGIALGLNPLPGTNHIHAWIDTKTNALCVHIGLQGREALARKESKYSYQTRPMTPDELQRHDVKSFDRGSVTELYRHDITREETALGIGVRPIIGIGVWRQGELIPKGRSGAWRADQRSLKDAIVQGYGLKLPDNLPDDAFRIIDNEEAIPAQLRDYDGELNLTNDEDVKDGHYTETIAETPEEIEQRKRDAEAIFPSEEGDQPTETTSEPAPVVKTEAELAAEKEAADLVEARKEYGQLFNKARKLGLKPAMLSQKDNSATLLNKCTTLSDQIKVKEAEVIEQSKTGEIPF